MPYHFQRATDESVEPAVCGTYRRVVELWANYLVTRSECKLKFWAEVCCPSCGHVGLVGSNHTVDSRGIVTPSDVCPFPPCTFHDYIVLDDWDRPGPSHPPWP